MRGYARSFNGISTQRRDAPFGWITLNHWASTRETQFRLTMTYPSWARFRMNGCVADRCADGFQRPMPVGQSILSRPGEAQAFQNPGLTSKIFVSTTKPSAGLFPTSIFPRD